MGRGPADAVGSFALVPVYSGDCPGRAGAAREFAGGGGGPVSSRFQPGGGPRAGGGGAVTNAGGGAGRGIGAGAAADGVRRFTDFGAGGLGAAARVG
ncbi:MAG: hypothetical protein ACK56I_14660, partial [bacterium]